MTTQARGLVGRAWGHGGLELYIIYYDGYNNAPCSGRDVFEFVAVCADDQDLTLYYSMLFECKLLSSLVGHLARVCIKPGSVSEQHTQ